MTITPRLFICVLTTVLLPIARLAYAANFSLWPAAAIDAAYDDNVRATPTNSKGDFLTVESLGGTLEAEAPKRSFFLTYTTLMLQHVSYPNQDNFGQDNYVGINDFERLSARTNLSISDTFLVGNAASGSFSTNGSTPIGSQLLSSILYSSGTLSNDFDLDLTSKYNESFSWSADLHQVFFSLLANTATATGTTSLAASKNSFEEGGSLSGNWELGERFTAGVAYNFDDYRFSADLPTTEAHWPQLRLGWGEGTPFSLLAQVGPIISQSSSGTIGTTPKAAQTKVEMGYLVTGSYTNRRLTFTASAGQMPETSAGLGAFSVSQTYSALIQYKLSRRATVFANFGFMGINTSGLSIDILTYTAGVSYRLTRMFTVEAQYLGIQEIGGGVTSGTLVATPGGQTVTNVFMLGMTITTLPLEWRL